MIDAKRLAEQMQPEKMRGLAEFLDRLQENHEGYIDLGMLDCAAAVLREVAGRGEKPGVSVDESARLMGKAFKTAGVGCEPEIFTEPMPPPITDDTPKILLGTNTGTEYAILQWGDSGPCLCSKHRAGAWVFLEKMSVEGILNLMRGVHDGRYWLDEWAAQGLGAPDADAIRDGIAQAFAEMPEQIYNAISEAVWSYLRQNGVRCPKA